MRRIPKHIITGAVYRHKQCLDIDIEVEEVTYRGPEFILVNIAYLNRNWQNGEFLVLREQNVKLVKKHWPMWERIRR